MTEGVRVPDEIRERVRAAMVVEWLSHYGDQMRLEREDEAAFDRQADAVLASLDRGALMAMLGAEQVECRYCHITHHIIDHHNGHALCFTDEDHEFGTWIPAPSEDPQ